MSNPLLRQGSMRFSPAVFVCLFHSIAYGGIDMSAIICLYSTVQLLFSSRTVIALRIIGSFLHYHPYFQSFPSSSSSSRDKPQTAVVSPTVQ
jgi:hypothetical protein